VHVNIKRAFGALGGVGTGYICSGKCLKVEEDNGNNTLHFKMNACMMTVLQGNLTEIVSDEQTAFKRNKVLGCIRVHTN